MRSTLSPAFTGSKLRNMVPLITDCNKQLMDGLEKEIKENSGKYLPYITNILRKYWNLTMRGCCFSFKKKQKEKARR